LAGLSNEGLISVWHDRKIDGGEYWVSSIENQLELSKIILLLVSPSFLASDYCYGVELERALEREVAGDAKVIPVILRPSDWEKSELGALQALPTGGRAITTWPNRDEAFLDVVAGLRSAIAKSGSAWKGASSAQSISDSSAMHAGTVRYYLYVSDSKVNMLFPQIPRDLKRDSAAEQNVPGSDRSMIETSTAFESERIYRLETVTSFIRQNYDVGSVNEPKEYIAGTHELYWGHLHKSMSTRRDYEDPLVLFNGHIGNTGLLMCGSSKHMIGQIKPRESGHSSSSVPDVIRSLMKEIVIDEKPVDSLNLGNCIESQEETKFPYVGNEHALDLVCESRTQMGGASQKLEFLAKILLQGIAPKYDAHCILASPIYVSLAF